MRLTIVTSLSRLYWSERALAATHSPVLIILQISIFHIADNLRR